LKELYINEAVDGQFFFRCFLGEIPERWRFDAITLNRIFTESSQFFRKTAGSMIAPLL
jgi:hypothetical protein